MWVVEKCKGRNDAARLESVTESCGNQPLDRWAGSHDFLGFFDWLMTGINKQIQ